MGRIPPADGKLAGRKSSLQIGVRGLLVLVASCALISWAGLRIRNTLAEDEMLWRLRSGTPDERRVAANYFASVARDSEIEGAFSALIGALRDTDAGVRDTAVRSLGKLVYQLRDHPPSGSIDPDQLKRWIEIVRRILVPLLSDLLSDPDPRIRAAAATGLGTMAGRTRSWQLPTPEQRAALKDASNAVRRQTAQAVYGSPDLTFPPELVAALRDESAEVRAAAAGALGSFGPIPDPEIPTLLAMLEHDAPAVRFACSRALSEAWPSPALVPTLIEALKSRDQGTRYYAAELLGRIGPEARGAIPALIAVLREPLDLDKSQRARDLGSYLGPAYAAARALGQMGPSPAAVAALIEVLSPENVERRMASQSSEQLVGATEGLGGIGPPAVAAVPSLIAMYKKVLESKGHELDQPALYQLRLEIPRALGRIAPNTSAAPDAVTILVRGLDSRIPYIRLGAAGALGHFGTDASAAIPKLRALQEDPDSSVRGAATKSLAAIEGRGRSRPNAGGSPAR